ncbi:hypothetical protein ACJIZ3_025615 [Penstemon smallii]|uniref:Glycine-rich protein n=1 Tax=Penstemon smallii TaxID=265156 RepID=A0ABD3TV51_9LAMI
MAAASSSSEITTEGPVLNLINKRLRALRKKLNRISQMEDSLSQGKTLNKEQEETFRSKPSVLSAIDELEKLREPLAQAIGQEIQLALEKKDETPIELKGAEKDEFSIVSDLLNLIYFGSIFDVKTLMRAHENLLTRTHERNCCLTYDYVTDDDAAGDPLREWDLDLISELGGFLISRPMTSSLSHKNALLNCVEHAKLWLANSEQPIMPNSNITYAGLKEKLNKIMASDYFITTPEIKAPVEVAAAAGNFTFQMHEPVIPPVSATFPVESPASEYPQEEEESPNSHGNEIYDDETGPVEEVHQEQEGRSEVEITSVKQTHNELEIPDTEVDQNSRDVDSKEQQYGNRRSYQNYRGGRGGNRRGYANGRGGRGGNRGGYQNGRSQIYDQPSGYYPRNHNYRGRGGRGMGGNYNYQASTGQPSHAQEAS